MLDSKGIVDLNFSLLSISELSANNIAGSPFRRPSSITGRQLLPATSKTIVMTSRTEVPRPLPTFIVKGILDVESAAARFALAISLTST